MDVGSGQETSFQDGTSCDGYHVMSHDEYHVTGDLPGRAGIGTGRFHVGMLSHNVLDLGQICYRRDGLRLLH